MPNYPVEYLQETLTTWGREMLRKFTNNCGFLGWRALGLKMQKDEELQKIAVRAV
jgi:hypothetical protein